MPAYQGQCISLATLKRQRMRCVLKSSAVTGKVMAGLFLLMNLYSSRKQLTFGAKDTNPDKTLLSVIWIT